MMKSMDLSKVLTVLTILATLNATAAWATLERIQLNGDSVVSDSANGLYWYPTLTDFAQLRFDQKIEKIEGFNQDAYAGRTGWHLGTPTEVANLLNHGGPAIAEVFTGYFDPRAGAYRYWFGIYDHVPMAGYHSYDGYYLSSRGVLERHMGNHLDADGNYVCLSCDCSTNEGSKVMGAWVAAPIPVPGTLFLTGFGATLVAGVFRRWL